MNAKKAALLGLAGLAGGGALVAFGVTPDGLSDEMTKHIGTLHTAGALGGTGVEFLPQAGFDALSDNAKAAIAHHFVVDGGNVITIAKDAPGFTADAINGLSSNALKEAAWAVNGFAVDPGKLANALGSLTIDNTTKDQAIHLLSTLVGEGHAKEFVDGALTNGGKLTEAALSFIGKTPLEESVLLANVTPPAIGAAAGVAVGALLPTPEKPIVGPKTAALMAQRQQDQQNALKALQGAGIQTA